MKYCLEFGHVYAINPYNKNICNGFVFLFTVTLKAYTDFEWKWVVQSKFGRCFYVICVDEKLQSAYSPSQNVAAEIQWRKSAINGWPVKLHRFRHSQIILKMLTGDPRYHDWFLGEKCVFPNSLVSGFCNDFPISWHIGVTSPKQFLVRAPHLYASPNIFVSASLFLNSVTVITQLSFDLCTPTPDCHCRHTCCRKRGQKLLRFTECMNLFLYNCSKSKDNGFLLSKCTTIETNN